MHTDSRGCFPRAVVTALLLLAACSGDDPPFRDVGLAPQDAMGAGDATVAPPDRAAPPDAPSAADVPAIPTRDGGPGEHDGGCSGAGTVDPYPALTTDGEVTDPASCSGCPGAFERFTTTPLGERTIRVAGFSTGATACQWVVVSHACGVESGTLDVNPDGGDFSGTVPLFCGENLVRVICRSSATSRRVRVFRTMGRACAGDDLRLTLNWDARVRDGELHLLRAAGRLNHPTDDCTWTTCIEPARLDWGTSGDRTDDPTKDVDDVSTAGSEHITLTRAPAGTYHVMVEHWSSAGETGDVSVLINTLGRATIRREITNVPAHWVWYVGTVTFPGGVFTPADASMVGSGRRDLIDCTASWGVATRGCDLPLPR